MASQGWGLSSSHRRSDFFFPHFSIFLIVFPFLVFYIVIFFSSVNLFDYRTILFFDWISKNNPHQELYFIINPYSTSVLNEDSCNLTNLKFAIYVITSNISSKQFPTKWQGASLIALIPLCTNLNVRTFYILCYTKEWSNTNNAMLDWYTIWYKAKGKCRMPNYALVDVPGC